jgi:hypothetical protein
MSLPSQNCSTELPIKYSRRHAYLSSSTDRHDNDSLATQQHKNYKTSVSAHAWCSRNSRQIRPLVGTFTYTTLMSQVNSTLSPKTSRQEGRTTEDNSHDPLKWTKVNDQNCSMSSEQEPSTPLLSTPKGMQNYLEPSLRTSAGGRLGGTQMLVTKSPILIFASRSTQQSGSPSVRDCT